MIHAIMPHGGSVPGAFPGVNELNRLWVTSIQFPAEACTYPATSPATSPPPRTPWSPVFYALFCRRAQLLLRGTWRLGWIDNLLVLHASALVRKGVLFVMYRAEWIFPVATLRRSSDVNATPTPIVWRGVKLIGAVCSRSAKLRYPPLVRYRARGEAMYISEGCLRGAGRHRTALAPSAAARLCRVSYRAYCLMRRWRRMYPRNWRGCRSGVHTTNPRNGSRLRACASSGQGR